MNILIIDGHPDPSKERFCHALATTYQKSAESAGHKVTMIKIADLDIPCLRSKAEAYSDTLPSKQLEAAQEAIALAEHIVIVYPLWLGDVPAYLKAFLEHVFSPGIAFDEKMKGKLKNKTARIIVTMGMPAFFYRWFFWSHSLTSLKRNILKFVGIKSIGETLIGSIETADHKKWLQAAEKLGHYGI